MRTTKALLLGAALGVASILPSSAQVFSVNIVGYVNVPLVVGWNLVANPLNCTLPRGNVVSNIFGYPTDLGFAVYRWDPTLTPPQYVSTRRQKLGPNVIWSSPAIGSGGDMDVSPGSGLWVYNPSNATTLTFVGEVPTGQQDVAMGQGFNLVGLKIPQSGKIQTDLGYTPSSVGATAGKYDIVYKWQPTMSPPQYLSYVSKSATWFGNEPVINPGEGFWVYRTTGVAYPNYTWSRTFNVQ